MKVVILSQPGCGPCRFVVHAAEQAGVDAEVRNIREDPEAEQLLRELYAAYRPGDHPSTPVTVIDDRPYFGTAGRDVLRAAA